MKLPIAYAFAFAVAPIAALSQPTPMPSIFGLEVSQPIKGHRPCRYIEVVPDKGSCLSHAKTEPGKPGRPSGGSVRLSFAFGELPSWATCSCIDLETVDNKLERLRIPTGGVRSQAAAMQALIEKFGPPTTRSMDEVQNGFGAKYAVAKASWRRSNWRVDFYGALGEFDTGVVFISTDKWDEFEALNRQRSQPRKL